MRLNLCYATLLHIVLIEATEQKIVNTHNFRSFTGLIGVPYTLFLCTLIPIQFMNTVCPKSPASNPELCKGLRSWNSVCFYKIPNRF